MAEGNPPKLGGDFYGQMRPTNLLLKLDGAEEFDRQHYLYGGTQGDREVDPRFHPGLKHGRVKNIRDQDKVKTYADAGNPVDLHDGSLQREDIDPASVAGYVDPSFCAYCGERDMRPDDERAGGVWSFSEDYPALGILKGQCFAYFTHAECTATEFRAGPKKLVLPNNGWNRLIGNRHLMIEERIIGFLKMAHQTGKHEYFKRHDS